MLAFCSSAYEGYQFRAHQGGMLWNIEVTTLQLLNTQTLICHNVTMLAFHISALGSINPEHIKKGSYGPMVSQLCILDIKLSQTLSCRIVTMLAFHISALGSINPEHIKKGSYGPMVSQLCILDTKLSQTLSCRIVTMLAFCVSCHEEYQSRALK